MTRFLVFGGWLVFHMLLAGAADAEERPNFVWILSEDNSKHFLKLFDEHGAETPEIAKLAAHGVVFEHAFSNAPVCSVARTTLITSVYAPRIGTQYHRRSREVRLPAGWKMFPAYLRDAGYYTTNNAKKDYNAVETSGTWDESSNKASWRNRPDAAQPFFHMQTFTDSHESSLHFTREQMESETTATDPAGVFLPPYHPDTPTFRYTYARYHDRIQVIDRKVGNLVKQLEDDGLLEETFVFYFGDHGGVLPRGKGYLYETGLHVPLVVRVPEKFRDLVAFPDGTRAGGFVNFVDFGPTLLHLAGIEVPAHMDGTPFLGPGVTLDALNARDETFGYADRFDEKSDMVRTLRRGKWKYHRNFQSYLPDALHNNYRYNMLAYREWRELFRAGGLNEVQRAFFEPKAPEALYDLENDPYETVNLANDPAHRETLLSIRARLQTWMSELPDLSLFPENILVEQVLARPEAIPIPDQIRRNMAEQYEWQNVALLPFEEARPKLLARLGEGDEGKVYWALIACCQFGKEAESLTDAVRRQLGSDEPLLRLQAAVFLAIVDAEPPQPVLKEVLRDSQDPIFNTLVLNQIVYLRDTLGYEFDLKPEDVPAKNDGVTRRLEYLGVGK